VRIVDLRSGRRRELVVMRLCGQRSYVTTIVE
jgi:hypothetical protein